MRQVGVKVFRPHNYLKKAKGFGKFIPGAGADIDWGAYYDAIAEFASSVEVINITAYAQHISPVNHEVWHYYE